MVMAAFRAKRLGGKTRARLSKTYRLCKSRSPFDCLKFKFIVIAAFFLHHACEMIFIWLWKWGARESRGETIKARLMDR
jgi:hypothetical protein